MPGRGAPAAHLHPLRRPQGLRLARRNVRHGQRRQMPASQSRGCRQRSADGRPLGFRNRPPRYGRHSRKCRLASINQSYKATQRNYSHLAQLIEHLPIGYLRVNILRDKSGEAVDYLLSYINQQAGRILAPTRRAMPEDGPRGGNRSPETHPHIRAHPLLLLLGADREKPGRQTHLPLPDLQHAGRRRRTGHPARRHHRRHAQPRTAGRFRASLQPGFGLRARGLRQLQPPYGRGLHQGSLGQKLRRSGKHARLTDSRPLAAGPSRRPATP